MQLAYADRDFYCGDPYFPPEEPVAGLVSKAYAKPRFAQMSQDRNDAAGKARRPLYAFQGGANPFPELLSRWSITGPCLGSARWAPGGGASDDAEFDEAFTQGHDEHPSRGQGWLARLDHAEWRLLAGGDRGANGDRALAVDAIVRDRCRGRAYNVVGGNTQEQELLQFFLVMVELARSISGPITAIWLDRKHRSMWGAASNFGEDYGIAW